MRKQILNINPTSRRQLRNHSKRVHCEIPITTQKPRARILTQMLEGKVQDGLSPLVSLWMQFSFRIAIGHCARHPSHGGVERAKLQPTGFIEILRPWDCHGAARDSSSKGNTRPKTGITGQGSLGQRGTSQNMFEMGTCGTETG